MTQARSSEYELARSFSHPVRTSTGVLVRDVASLYAGAVADLVAGALARGDPFAHEGVAEHLTRALAFSAREHVLGIVWCTAIGECIDAVRRNDSEGLARAVAAWCIEATALGCPGRWRIGLADAAASLLWDALLLPPAESLTVESDGTTAHVTVGSNGQSQRLLLSRDPMSGAWSGPDLARAVRVGAGTEIVLLPRQVVPGEDFADLRPVMLDPIPAGAVSGIGAALDLLRAQDAGYHGWVERAFRCLFVVTAPEGHLVSGSLAGKPRFGYVSDAERSVATCEMLIHEASHQYFHLLAKVGPVTSGDDEERFYSPFVKTLRPLSRLLLAYHAFANVISFYARAVADGVDPDYCERSMGRLLEDVSLVERTIDDNHELLTPLGRGLFEPLKEQLSGARAIAVH